MDAHTYRYAGETTWPVAQYQEVEREVNGQILSVTEGQITFSYRFTDATQDKYDLQGERDGATVVYSYMFLGGGLFGAFTMGVAGIVGLVRSKDGTTDAKQPSRKGENL